METKRHLERTADAVLMRGQSRNQTPCNTGYAQSLPPPELSWLLCWCPFSTLGYLGCSHPGLERTITSGTEISLQIQWQSGEYRLKCLNAKWGGRTLWKLVQLMFCLINLQMVHRLCGNPAVHLRDSVRDVENLEDSSLECLGSGKSDQSSLEWMNSTAKGAVLGM